MAKSLHNNAEILSAAYEKHHCWRCGASLVPPSPAEWRAIVRDIQLARPPIFFWPEEDLERLEHELVQGDFVVAIYASMVVARHPGGTEFKVHRSDETKKSLNGSNDPKTADEENPNHE